MEQGTLRIPLFESLAPGAFKYGTVVLVEFQAHSLWYDTSYTLAAQGLKAGIKTDYHVFQRPPDDAKNAISKLLGVDLSKEATSTGFRIIDSYTVQMGHGTPVITKPYSFTSASLKMSDWKAQMFGVFDEPTEARQIHIDENDSVLTNYNTEAEVLDFFRRTYTAARERGFLFVYAILLGIHSPSFYTQFESLADVVLDFQSPEESGHVKHLVRVRIARGTSHYNSQWRRLRTLPNNEVVLEQEEDEGTNGRLVEKVQEEEPRKLVAIMFTDIVGYTALSQKDEPLSVRILDFYYQILRRFFRKFGGREIKTIGDAFLIEFESSVNAVRCAVALQEQLRSEPGPAGVIPVRVGIHLGEVIQRSGDILGDAVNLASRIVPLAGEGEICISRPVWENTANKLRYEFTSMGTFKLKNVSTPLEVYKVNAMSQNKHITSKFNPRP